MTGTMPANVARLKSTMTKQAKNEVKKKILVQLEAALEVSSSRKIAGN